MKPPPAVLDAVVVATLVELLFAPPWLELEALDELSLPPVPATTLPPHADIAAAAEAATATVTTSAAGTRSFVLSPADRSERLSDMAER